MPKPLESAAAFRLELFVDEVTTSVDFYRQVLGFQIGEPQSDSYTPMTNGQVYVSLNRRANLPDAPPIQTMARERLGRGVEFVLEVNDIEVMYAHVLYTRR